MRSLLQEPAPREDEIREAFARSARLALAGMLAPPALLGLASAAGYPLRAAADPAFWIGALAGFGGAGWFAGRRLGIGPRREAALAGAYLVAALLVSPVFRELNGLTGREPALAVAAATLGAFGMAFALSGWLSSKAVGVTRIGARGVACCAAGGLAGGGFAMLPFCWARLRLDVPGESYLVMTLAVVGFLGCLIAPFHIVGLVLDRARDRMGLART
ncbi:MAG: hypothetical protein R6V57_18575 [Vicinamibacterales bacterium]